MSKKAIVLDTNILIRAVLGKRVRELIVANAGAVQFFTPDVAYADARKYFSALLEKRGVNSEAALTVLDALESIVQPLERGVYSGLQSSALKRIATRDADDRYGPDSPQGRVLRLTASAAFRPVIHKCQFAAGSRRCLQYTSGTASAFSFHWPMD